MSSSSQHVSGVVAASSSGSPSPSEGDGSPSLFSAPVVLLRGPDASSVRAVLDHVTSQLASGPALPLKVLDKGTFEQEIGHLSDYSKSEIETSLESSETGPSGSKWADWTTNSYKTFDVKPYGRSGQSWRQNRYKPWKTIEIPDMQCFRPPLAPLSLFSGVVAFFTRDLSSGSIHSLHHSTSGSAALLLQSYKDVFQAFGGTVVDEVGSGTTHRISCSKINRSDTVGMNGVRTVHPHWISLSVSLGALIPTSLFEFEARHPVTTVSESYPYPHARWRKIDGFLRTTAAENPCPSLFDVLGIAVGGLELAPASPVPSLVGRRLFFDISATSQGRRGAPPLLSQAVAAFVGRSGARVVTDIRAADWLVVSERSGDAYWHGLSNPTKIMGTLKHLLAHFDRVEEEPIDPRSNLLYFPLPVKTAKLGCLPSVNIFISHHYPEAYRRYLAELIVVLRPENTGYTRPLHPPRGRNPEKSIVVSPTMKPNSKDANEDGMDPTGPRLLAKFLEDSFLRSNKTPLFDLDKQSFRRKDLACFSPTKLPKDFHLVEHEPARLDDKHYDKLYSIESSWKYHSEKLSSYRLCMCTACFGAPQ